MEELQFFRTDFDKSSFEHVVEKVPEIRRKSLRRKSVVVIAYCWK